MIFFRVVSFYVAIVGISSMELWGNLGGLFFLILANLKKEAK